MVPKCTGTVLWRRAEPAAVKHTEAQSPSLPQHQELLLIRTHEVPTQKSGKGIAHYTGISREAARPSRGKHSRGGSASRPALPRTEEEAGAAQGQMEEEASTRRLSKRSAAREQDFLLAALSVRAFQPRAAPGLEPSLLDHHSSNPMFLLTMKLERNNKRAKMFTKAKEVTKQMPGENRGNA